jgi:pimeloyl-ACP methyl ester carboxylesterase
MTMRRIDTNGISLNVEIHGQGEPVLFLHGWPDDASVWRKQIPGFVAAGYQCVIPNLRGVGGSDGPEDVKAYRTAELSADVIGILDELSIESVKVVGHDWGASLVWGLLSLHSTRFRRAVVMSVGHPACMWDMTNIKQRAASWYAYYFQLDDFSPTSFSDNDFEVFRAFMADAPDVERRIRRFKAYPDQFVNHIKWYQGLDGARASKQRYAGLPKIRVPMLALAGENDFALTIDQLKDSADYVVGEYEFSVLPRVGHWMQLEAPDVVNRLLLAYLEK